MASNRRIGLEQSKTRAQLLDAADAVMREEGYAAVSSRRVASRAGLKPQLVHYYFRTMDDLFLALFQRRTEDGLARHAEALETDQPLRAVWEVSRDPEGTAMIQEFSALANHRKVIAAEIQRYGEELREMQAKALARHLAARGVDPQLFPPTAVSILLTSLSLFLRMEDNVGIRAGHAETEALVERWLAQLDGAPLAPRPAPAEAG